MSGLSKIQLPLAAKNWIGFAALLAGCLFVASLLFPMAPVEIDVPQRDPDVPGNPRFTVHNGTLTTNDQGQVVVGGEVTNNTQFHFDHIEIRLALIDSTGHQFQYAWTSLTYSEPGRTLKFEIPVNYRTKTALVSEVSGC